MTHLVDALGELRNDTEAIGSQTGARRNVSVGFGRWQRYLRPITAMAAAVTVVIGAWLYFGAERAIKPIGPAAPTRSVASLSGESAEKFLAVARPTSEPHVKVYWLYPTLMTESEDDSS